MSVDHVQALVPAVELILKKAVAEATEVAIAKAVGDFEATLRRRIALNAIEVSNFYEVSQQRNNLVISVKIPSENTTTTST